MDKETWKTAITQASKQFRCGDIPFLYAVAQEWLRKAEGWITEGYPAYILRAPDNMHLRVQYRMGQDTHVFTEPDGSQWDQEISEQLVNEIQGKLGKLANDVRQQRNEEPLRTYVRERGMRFMDNGFLTPVDSPDAGGATIGEHLDFMKQMEDNDLAISRNNGFIRVQRGDKYLDFHPEGSLQDVRTALAEEGAFVQ